MEKSLYERLGGDSLMEPAVHIFYEKMLADPSLRPFFETTNMPEQLEKQRKFLAYAFGGPAAYTGKSLRAAHAPLVKRGLNIAHFLSVAVHLHATLEELGVTPGLIDEVMNIVAATQDDVLGVNN